MSEDAVTPPIAAFGKRWRRLLLPLLVVVPLYFLFLAYPPLRLIGLLQPQWQPQTLVLLAIFVGPALGRLAYEQFPGAFTRNLAALTMTWCGVCFIALSLLLPYELLNLALALPGPTSGLYLLGGTAALSFIALVNAQQLMRKTFELDVPAAKTPLTLVQISDVHIGSRRPGFLNRVVRQVNDISADYVLITGDLIDFSDISQAQLQPLSELRAPALFCIGNHERYVDLQAICTRLENLGITVLRNQTVTHADVQFIGIDDAESKNQIPRQLPRIDPIPDKLRILLYHRPDGAEAAAAWGAHLMLCGHTHNGQIFPFNYLVKRQFARIQGLYPISDMFLYVSPGTGTWGPVMRLGTRSEITEIRIKPHRR